MWTIERRDPDNRPLNPRRFVRRGYKEALVPSRNSDGSLQTTVDPAEAFVWGDFCDAAGDFETIPSAERPMWSIIPAPRGAA